MFKDNFKYYKSRNPRPNLKNVIDLNNPDYNKVCNKFKKIVFYFMYISCKYVHIF